MIKMAGEGEDLIDLDANSSEIRMNDDSMIDRHNVTCG